MSQNIGDFKLFIGFAITISTIFGLITIVIEFILGLPSFHGKYFEDIVIGHAIAIVSNLYVVIKSGLFTMRLIRKLPV